jgi:Ti-type conjugative transfer relaxase TraA
MVKKTIQVGQTGKGKQSMAIYHFSGKVISRSTGRSVVAAAAYRAADHLMDERYDQIRDYTHKSDVAHAEILLPVGTPDWMADREKLWNAVEAVEKRKDAQLAREFQIALPRELTLKQNIELACEFVQREFVARGMIADFAIHNDKGKDGESQPHIHVLLTLREITPDGFGQKVRAWNDKSLLLGWREAWAEVANRHLAFYDHDIRIDHRTLAEQGIDLEPQSKIGATVVQDRMARMADHQRIARENGERILDNPLIAFEALTRQQSTFTHHDIARFASRHSVEVEQFNRLMVTLKTHAELVSLGKDDRGLERWTTQTLLTLEKNMIAQAVDLAQSQEHGVSPRHIERVKANSTLTPEQTTALIHLTGASDLSCVVGFAGTGKSYLLGAAREVWEKQGYRVLGATLSGIAAEGLAGSSGIESRTLASRLYYWDKGEQRLTANDVLVVDEAGMLGSRQMARVMDEVQASGAKVVLVGDPEQLQAIEAGAAFRAILERVGFEELTEIRRQGKVWQQEATKALATHKTDKALAAYQKHGAIQEFSTRAQAQTALIQSWDATRLAEPDKTQLILAYTRAEVRELNDQARACRQSCGELGKEQIVLTARGERSLAEQDRIYFLKNDRDLGVMNGSLGTVEKLKGDRVTVRLDAVERGTKAVHARRVQFSLSEYNHLDHGYAATLHKSQGVTVDRSHVLASTYLDRQSAYVALSRHREEVKLYWSREDFADRAALTRTLSRDRAKDVSVDYDMQRSSEGWSMTREFAPVPLPPPIHEQQPPSRSGQDSLSPAEMNKAIDAFLQKQNWSPDRAPLSGREADGLSSGSSVLEAFKAQFEAAHPEQVRQISERISPRHERLALETIREFGALEKALTDSLTPHSAQTQIERYAEKISKNSAVMSYLHEHTPELSEKIHDWASSRAKTLEKQRDIGDREL